MIFHAFDREFTLDYDLREQFERSRKANYFFRHKIPYITKTGRRRWVDGFYRVKSEDRDDDRYLDPLLQKFWEQWQEATYLALNDCQAASDGECNGKNCPQLLDKEPHSTGRHCPLDRDWEEF